MCICVCKAQKLMFRFSLVLMFLSIGPAWSGLDSDQCHPWSFYNDTLQHCQCYGDPEFADLICSEERVLVALGNCLTHEESGTFLGYCRTFLIHDQNVTVVYGAYVQLPDNISELNDYMCGPMNRKGRVCSECIDGFAPSVTSIGYECSNCTDTWYGVPLYLLLEFVPITIFYLTILIFQISVTSAPMTSCVMYSQLTVSVIVHHSKPNFFLESISAYKVINVLTILHGIWNLDFFRYTVPPFCVSPNMKNIHILFLDYISAVYPLMLIAVTWVCIELHSHNYKPLVWLWNKLSCLKIKRDHKSTIIDVFATFFFLSYTKLCFTSLRTLGNTYISTANNTEPYLVTYEDPSVVYFSKEHLPFAVIAILIFLVSGLLPALLLAIYPIRIFRSVLLKCIPGGRSRAALNIFAEKFYSCYRDGLDGGRDMRSFASLYLFVRILGGYFLFSWTYQTLLFGVCCLVVALVRPYKKTYMNNTDALVLAIMTLNCFQLKNFFSAPFKSTDAEFYLWSAAVTSYLPLFVVPFSIFPCKRLCNVMKQIFTCKCFYYSKPEEIHNIDSEGDFVLSDSDSHDPHQMVHPDQYSTGDTNGISEADALLHA